MRIQRTSGTTNSEETDKEEEFECLLNRQREQAKIIKAAQHRVEQAEEELKNAQANLEAVKRVQMEICLQVQQFSWTDNNNKNGTTLIHNNNNNNNNNNSNGESRNSLPSSSHISYSNNNKTEPVSPNIKFNPRSRKDIVKKTKKGHKTHSNRLKRVSKRQQIIKETETEFNNYIQRVVEETNENIEGLYDRAFIQNRVRYICKVIHRGTKQQCGVIKDSPSLIREHIQQRSGIRPFKCKICPDIRYFRTKWEASKHVRHNPKHKQRKLSFNLSLSTKDETEGSLSADSQVLRNNVPTPQTNSKKRCGRNPNAVIRRGNRIIDPVSHEFNKYIERLSDKIDYKAYYRCTEDEDGRKRYICQARHGSRRKYGKECGLIGLTSSFIINHLKQKMKVPVFQCKICPEIKPFSNKVLANRHLRHSVGHAKHVFDIEANYSLNINENLPFHDSFNGEGLETENSVAHDDNSNDADEFRPLVLLTTEDDEEMNISDISVHSENESQSSIIRINRNFNKVKLESDFRPFEIKREPENDLEHPLESDTQVIEESLQSEIQPQPQQQQHQQQLDNISSGSGNHRNYRPRTWSCEPCKIRWKSEISLKRHNIKYHQARQGRKRNSDEMEMEMEQTDEENTDGLLISCSFCEHYSNSIEAQAIHSNDMHKIPRVILPKLVLTNYEI